MLHPAQVLEHGHVRWVLRHLATHRHACRDRMLILLSFKAGLRACEIAGLTWPMLLQPDGRIGDQVFVAATIAKYGLARRIPLHPELSLALADLHLSAGQPRAGPVARSERGSHMTPRSIVNWFAATYASLSLDGCSSHSGRRTFITRSARLLSRTGGSLRDVQELAGHKRLTTTECYIEGDRDAQRQLIRLV